MKRPKRKKPARKPGRPRSPGKTGHRLFASMAAASGALHVPIEVLKRAKAAGCPAFKARGSVDEAELLEWFKAHPDVDGGEISTKEKIALEVLRKAKRINDAADKLLIEKTIVAQAVGRMCIEAAAILRQRLEIEYPATCVNLDMNGLRARGMQVYDETMKALNKLKELWPVDA